MPITRSVWIDDDGSGTTGTVLNNSELQTIYNNIDAALVGGGAVTAKVVEVPTTGTVHNLACGTPSVHTVIRCTNTTDLTITGFAFSPAARPGDMITIQARGAGIVWLLSQTGSSAGNLLANFANSGPTPLSGIYGRATYIYDISGYWMMHTHEQGAWITPPFSAANYTNITATAGQIQMDRYRLSGRTISWLLSIWATSVVAPGPVYRLGYGGFTVVAIGGPFDYQEGAGATSRGVTNVGGGGIQFVKDFSSNGFTTSPFYLRGMGHYEVS